MSRPLVFGAAAGLIAAAALAVPATKSLSRLDDARTRRAHHQAVLDDRRPIQPPAPHRDPAALAADLRQRAVRGGLLVERVSIGRQDALGLLDLSLSGPEKAVLALADAIERDGGLRFARWRLAGEGSAVRLDARLVVP